MVSGEASPCTLKHEQSLLAERMTQPAALMLKEAAWWHLQRECLSPPVCCWMRGAAAPRPVGQIACKPGVLVEKWRPREEPPVQAGGSNAEKDLKTQRCYE